MLIASSWSKRHSHGEAETDTCDLHEECENREYCFCRNKSQMAVTTLCHLTYMESQLGASTPPGAVVNRTPGQLFGEGLQEIQPQCCEENHHQCN